LTPARDHLFRRLPAEVHVHIDRLPIETVPVCCRALLFGRKVELTSVRVALLRAGAGGCESEGVVARKVVQKRRATGDLSKRRTLSWTGLRLPTVPPSLLSTQFMYVSHGNGLLLLQRTAWCCIDYGGGNCAQASSLPGSLVRSVWTLSYCTVFVVLVASGWWRLLRRLLLLSRGRLLSR
jgi:hypothetical protein